MASHAETYSGETCCNDIFSSTTPYIFVIKSIFRYKTRRFGGFCVLSEFFQID